jgi:hypothetical protein
MTFVAKVYIVRLIDSESPATIRGFKQFHAYPVYASYQMQCQSL